MIAFFLKIWTFVKKYLKYIVGAVAAVVIIALSTATARQRTAIREDESEIANLEKTISEKNELITRLASMEAVHCEVSITVRNTAVMGANHSGNIAQEAEQISTYLRGEILDKIMHEQ